MTAQNVRTSIFHSGLRALLVFALVCVALLSLSVEQLSGQDKPGEEGKEQGDQKSKEKADEKEKKPDEKEKPEPKRLSDEERRELLTDNEFAAPGKAAISAAAKELKRFKYLGQLQAWHRIVLPTKYLKSLPKTMQIPGLAELGETPMQAKLNDPEENLEAGKIYPNWAKLRLAALLQSGYAINEASQKDLKVWLESDVAKALAPEDALLEFILIERVLQNSEELKEAPEAKVRERASQVFKATRWFYQDDKRQKASFAMTRNPEAGIFSDLAIAAIVDRNKLKLDIADPEAMVAVLLDVYTKGNTTRLKIEEGGHINEGLWLTSPEILIQNALGLALNHLKLKGETRARLQEAYNTNKKKWFTGAGSERGGLATLLVTAGSDATGLKDKKLMEQCLPSKEEVLEGVQVLDGGVAALFRWNHWPQKQPNGFGAGNPALGLVDPSEHCIALMGAYGGLLPEKKVRPIKKAIESFVDHKGDLTTLALRDAAASFEELVNHALDRGARWLLRTQSEEGTFPGRFGFEFGGQSLMALALLDAGIERDNKQIERTVDYLRTFAKKKKVGIYGCGVGLMMYQKFYEAEQEKAGVLDAKDGETYRAATAKVFDKIAKVDKAIIEDLVKIICDKYNGNGWTYYSPQTIADRYDNSNSQYAVLGLKAASLLGASFDRDILAAEAKRWIKIYKPNEKLEVIEVPIDDHWEKPSDKEEGGDSKKTKQLVKVHPGGWGYTSDRLASAMTAGGVSSLAVCLDELTLAGTYPDELRHDIIKHMQGAMHQVGHLWRHDTSTNFMRYGGVTDGWGVYYELYSVERACVMTGTRLLYPDKDWYFRGAVPLLAAQASDGSWPVNCGPKNLAEGIKSANVALTLLFLKRAAVHTNTRPRLPITHRKKKKE